MAGWLASRDKPGLVFVPFPSRKPPFFGFLSTIPQKIAQKVCRNSLIQAVGGSRVVGVHCENL